MNIGLYSKNQCDNWTHLGDIADLLFLRALDLFRNSFTDPTKIARLICSFYEYPAVSNESILGNHPRKRILSDMGLEL